MREISDPYCCKFASFKTDLINKIQGKEWWGGS